MISLVFNDVLPRVELRDYVRLYHVRHFRFQRGIPVPSKPYPPRPEQTLLFYTRDKGIIDYIEDGKVVTRPSTAICGQQVKRINLQVGEDLCCIMVVFHPGMLYQLAGVPMHYFTHTEVDAESIFPGKINRVAERLNSTDDYAEMIKAVEEFLLDIVRMKRKSDSRIERISNYIFHTPENVNLDWLASQACLSQRQFIRKFYDHLGVSPKTFMRISRMYKTYNMHFRMPKKDWLSIALECGYTDYQHLAKDYRDFANTTPVSLFAEDQAAPERLFGQKEPGDHPGV